MRKWIVLIKPNDCPWCGIWTHYEMVKGHYQCTQCKRVVADCCDGEQEQIWEDLTDKAGS